MEPVLSKKEKFMLIMEQVSDICYIENYFKKRNRSLRSDFNESERKTLDILEDVYLNGLTPRNENNPEYDRYIATAIDFIRNVVEKYVPGDPVTYTGKPISLFFEDVKKLLSRNETECWKVGSRFFCTLTNGLVIEKIPLETDENGHWQNHVRGAFAEFELSKFQPEISAMGEGLYRVFSTGHRFDIKNYFGHLVLAIPAEDTTEAKHPVLSMLKSNHTQDENNEYAHPLNSICPICRGGGCPSCDTTGYFTGIRTLY